MIQDARVFHERVPAQAGPETTTVALPRWKQLRSGEKS